jgi:hypothetical protein
MTEFEMWVKRGAGLPLDTVKFKAVIGIQDGEWLKFYNEKEEIVNMVRLDCITMVGPSDKIEMDNVTAVPVEPTRN